MTAVGVSGEEAIFAFLIRSEGGWATATSPSWHGGVEMSPHLPELCAIDATPPAPAASAEEIRRR